jgi:hypothetical protein
MVESGTLSGTSSSVPCRQNVDDSYHHRYIDSRIHSTVTLFEVHFGVVI